MIQMDRLEDISAMRSSTIRFLVSTVSGHNLPSTTAALEELSTQSVALHRYILRHVLSSTFTVLKVLTLTSSAEDEVVHHTNYTVVSKEEVDGANPSASPPRSRTKQSEEALIQLARSLVLSALHKPNAITLIGGSLDFLAPVPTSSPTFSSSMTSSQGGRLMGNSLSSPLVPSSPLSTTIQEVIPLFPKVLHYFLQHILQLSNIQIFLFVGALSVASVVPSVKEAAITVALELEAQPAGANEKKDDSVLRSLTFLLKISSTPSASPVSSSFSSPRPGEETNLSSPPPLTKAFETRLEQFFHSGNSTTLSSSTAVPGVSLVSLTPSLFSSAVNAAASPLPFSAPAPLTNGISSTSVDRILSTTTGVEAGDVGGSRSPSVSIGAILREVGTGCVTTTAESKELLRLLGKKITEADIAEVLGFFASSATTNVNDASAYRMLSAIFSSTPDSVDGEGIVEAAAQGRGGMNGNLSSISATSTNPSISMSNGSSNNGPTSVGMMMMSGGSAGVVNARPLLGAMHASGNSYNWEEVIRLLDVPDEDGFEPSTISLIFDAYHSFHKKPLPPSAGAKSTSVDTTEFTSRTNNPSGTSGGGEYPPITLFLGTWKNTKRQRSAIMYILQNPEKCNMKVLEEEMASNAKLKGERGPVFLPPAFVEALREDHNTSGTAAFTPGASPSSPNRAPTSTLNNSSSGNTNSSPTLSTSLLSSPLAALHLWGSPSFMEAALHVASRETRFDEDVLQPAIRAVPLLFTYVLFGLPQLKYSLKGIAILKKILANPLWRPSFQRMTTFILPQAEKNGNLSAWINLLSELTTSQPNTTVDVLEMVLHVKPLQYVLQTSSSPRLVVGVAMCMEEAAKKATSAGSVANRGPSQNATGIAAPGQNEPWLQRALEGHLHFSASSTENRFVVAMYVVEIAEMLLSKSRFIESATTALHALLNTPLKDMLPQIAESARVLLASVDYLFEPDIEKAATAIFLEMYESGTVETAIKQVRALRDSRDTRRKQIYACLVHIMFDETGSLSQYPPKELKLFGQLFGRLMVDNLLHPSQVTRAWALLLPAIIKPDNPVAGEYGIFALKEIKPRLAEWPQYCRALRQAKDLDFRVPGVMATIYRGIKEEVQATSAANAAAAAAATGGADGGEGGSTSLPGAGGTLRKALFSDPAILSASSSPGASDEAESIIQLHTLNIKALLADDSITSPPPVIQDQINFLVGNTDAKNLQRHAEEMALQLRPEYYEYFAHYLVVKRAALEPNNHALYSELIQQLQIKELKKATRTATVSAVKRLLSSPKISSSVADEWILLGNLGLWLGRITLQQDIPLLTVDLNFEALLADGLRNQRLAAAAMLMSRVLESCAKSNLFAPPNSWTMSQLSLFLQVSEFPSIKSRICIELDILLTKLSLHKADLKVFAENFQQSRRRLRQPPLLPKAYESLDRTHPHSDFTELQPQQLAVIAASEPSSVGGSATASRGPSPSPEGVGTASNRSASQRSSNLQRTAEPFHLSRHPSSSGGPQALDASPRSLGGGAPTGAINGQLVPPLMGVVPSVGHPTVAPLYAATAMRGAAPDSLRALPGQPPMDVATRDARPRIELTRQRIQIPQVLEQFIPYPEEFREKMFEILQEEVEKAHEDKIQEIATSAAKCTEQLFKKECRQLRNSSVTDEFREATLFMARSLAANDCFITLECKVEDVLQKKMEELLLQQLRTPGPNQKAIFSAFSDPNSQSAETETKIVTSFWDKGVPFFTDCGNLCLRVLEYKAGEYAVNVLLSLPLKFSEGINQEQSIPGTRPPVVQSFRDFFYCFPAANGFMHALRREENMINRGILSLNENTAGNGVASDIPGFHLGNLSPDSPAITPYENGEYTGTSSSGEIPVREQPTLSSEKKSWEKLITFESAVYIAGPMVLRLFATVRMDEDRIKENITAKGKSSASTSTVTNKNESAVSTASSPSVAHEGALGTDSAAGAQSSQEQCATAAASNSPENDEKGPVSAAAGTMAGSSPAVLSEVIATEAARQKRVSQTLWQLYLDILVTCLHRSEYAVREEVSTVFMQQDARFAYGNLVVDLLRHDLINPARLDENLVEVFRQPQLRASVSGLVAKLIQSDRLLFPSQLKNILQAMNEATELCDPPIFRATPLLLKPLAYLARRDVQKLILPLDLLCESEVAYLEISRELDNWILIKQKNRTGSSGGRQSSANGSSGTNPSSEDRAEGATAGAPAGAGGKAGSSSLPSGKTSNQEEPLDFSFVRELISKQYVTNAHIVPFFHSLVCICVEDHATCTLRHEQRALPNDKSVTPPAIAAASTAGTPLLNPDPWSPPKTQPPYDPAVFVKCDYFVALCSVLLRCACVRQDDTKTDTRGDVTLLRRVLDSVVRVLRKHHASEAMLEKWQPPKFRVPLPLNAAYVPVFMQQPYVRIFGNLLLHIQTFKPDAALTLPFLDALHYVSPLELPGFAFGWLEIVSHRVLLQRTLKECNKELWECYVLLLADALRFISVNTQRQLRRPGSVLFFKAFTKLIMVIHHDFPHFLLSQNYLLYNVTAPQYLHLLNLYNVRSTPHREIGASASNSSSPSSASSSSSGTAAASGEQKSGSGETDNEASSSVGSSHNPPGNSIIVNPPVYEFLPIEAVMKDLENPNIGFEKNLELLEAWTAALVAQAARNREMFREHPSVWGSAGDTTEVLADNTVVVPGNSVKNAFLTKGLLKVLVNHIKVINSPRILHALAVQAFFITTGISVPQLRWAAVHHNDGDNSATPLPKESKWKPDEEQTKRYKELLWEASTGMPPKVPPKLLCVNPPSPVLLFFRFLSDNLDKPRRYYLFHACAHHLRAEDSAETSFFAEVFMYLFTAPPLPKASVNSDVPSLSTNSNASGVFSDIGTDMNNSNAAQAAAAYRLQTGVQEQILRALLERALTYLPRPPGLTVTLRALMNKEEFKSMECSSEFYKVLNKFYGVRPAQQ